MSLGVFCDRCEKEIKDDEKFTVIEHHRDGSYSEEIVCWRHEVVNCSEFWNKVSKLETICNRCFFHGRCGRKQEECGYYYTQFDEVLIN